MLDEHEGLTVARVRGFHREPEVIPADCSSECEDLVSEENGAQHETAGNAVCEAAAGEEQPVEVVCTPVALEEDLLLNDSLLFSSVEAAGVDQT